MFLKEYNRSNMKNLHLRSYVTQILILSIIIIIFGQISSFAEEPKVNYFEMKKYFKEQFPGNNESREESNKWVQRWLWKYEAYIGPDGNIDYPEIINYTKTNKSNDDEILSQTGWIPVGPLTVPPTFEPRSCASIGRINCVAFHPNDSDIMWVGTPGGGVWKTINEGNSWQPLTDNLISLSVSDIAVDPIDPDIIYIASGDIDGNGITSPNAVGVFKSTDGGDSWDLTSLRNKENFQNSLLRKVLINPLNTNELVAAGTLGIWKSYDAGETWDSVSTLCISDLESDPLNSNIIYAATSMIWGYFGTPGVSKSTDFGSTWEILESGIPVEEVSRVEISVSIADPNYIYAIAVNYNRNDWSRVNGLHSIYRSTDAGESWELRADYDSTSNILGAYNGDENDKRGQGTYDLILIADPNDPDKVYAGGINVWASADGGKAWDLASHWIYVFGQSTHADQHFAAYNPIDKYIYICNDGGIYRTKSIEPGSKDWIDWIDRAAEDIKPGAPEFKFPTVWENLSDGLAITEFYRLSVARNEPGKITGGSQDNSCYYFRDGSWINYIANWDGMETMIDHNNTDIIYGVWQNGGLCKSYDGGKTIITGLADSLRGTLGERALWITPVSMDPLIPETIYIGFKNLWKSTNGGFGWEKAYNYDTLDKDIPYQPISIIRNSKSNSDYMCFYKSKYTQWINQDSIIVYPSQFRLTSDGGDSWNWINGPAEIEGPDIIDIRYVDNDPEKLILLFRGQGKWLTYLFTDNSGKDWVEISKPADRSLVQQTIISDPNSPDNAIFIGTNKGVYYTDDNLEEFVPFNKNLPMASITDMEIQEQTGELFVSTYGRGIWKAGIISGVEEQKSKGLNFEIYPNPVADELNLEFILKLESEVIVKIIDITGKEVYSKIVYMDGSKFTISTEAFQAGTYFAVIYSGIGFISEKFIIRR